MKAIVDILYGFFLISLLGVSLTAAPTSEYVPVLPGDGLLLEKLVAHTEIAIATVVLKDLGLPFGNEPGKYVYPNVRFEIREALRGKLDCGTHYGLRISFVNREENPIDGMLYIIFVNTATEAKVQMSEGAPKTTFMGCYKMLPANSQTIAQVKAAMAAAAKATPPPPPATPPGMPTFSGGRP
jgi:hypothetical protein